VNVTEKPVTHPQAPRDASALVVGLEKYGFADVGDIEGSVQLAARFVEWMIARGVCRPDRITFMAAYDEDKYKDGPYRESLSPKAALSALRRNAGINIVEHAEANKDFTAWINSNQYGPQPGDQRFLLFWIGHGHAIRNDPTQRLFLLSSDADDNKPKNVELSQLLMTVGAVAPDATVTGFVQACRASVPSGWEERLEKNAEEVSLREDPPHEADIRKQSVVYAAAHSETTKMAGLATETFAGALLNLLDVLPEDAGPEALFDQGKLKELIEQLWWQGHRPYQTTYGYQHGDERWCSTPPPDHRDLTNEEWLRLADLAEAIDRDPGTTGQLRWGAYCQAAGLGGAVSRPERLRSVKNLFLELRALPPTGERGSRVAPPLLIACDFIAHLAEPVQSGLERWCVAWADARGPDAHRLLADVQRVRPRQLEQRPYLSIMVDRMAPKPEKGYPLRRRPVIRYVLFPLFYAVTEPQPLDGHGPVVKDEILAEVEDVINEALNQRIVDRQQMIVEFVLPRGLLGWWLEYEPPRLGFRFPVVIRDLKRAFGADGVGAGLEAQEKLRQESQRRDGSPPSGKMIWLTCDQAQGSALPRAGAAASGEDAICVVLERASTEAAPNDGDVVPEELTNAIDDGAPVVVSVHGGRQCGNCPRMAMSSSGGSGSTCNIRAAKELLTGHVDDSASWPNGLLDLPFILRKIRRQVARGELTDLKVSVLMEDQSRLWPGFFHLASGYWPDAIEAGR